MCYPLPLNNVDPMYQEYFSPVNIVFLGGWRGGAEENIACRKDHSIQAKGHFFVGCVLKFVSQ